MNQGPISAMEVPWQWSRGNGGLSAPFWKLLAVNLVQGWRRLAAIGRQSKLLTTLIIGFVAGYLGLAFWLFYRGLKFANQFPGLGALLVERLWYLLFAFLFILLLFSNLVISYTNLFKNRETSFLLTLPLTPQQIFQWKFVESVTLASWAFVFLVAPMVAAFGITRGVAWHFYPASVLMMALLIVLPGIAGAWLAIGLAQYLERRTFQLVIMGGAVVLLTAAYFYLKPEPLPQEASDSRVLVVLDRMLSRTRFAELFFLPSYWISNGVLNWADGALAASLFFALVLLSHVLFWTLLTFAQVGRPFYNAASAVQSRGSVFGQWQWFRNWSRRRYQLHWHSGFLERFFSFWRFLPADVRAMVVKDLRMFWRDTTQWGQTIMLFGLLGVYVVNLRHFTSQLTNPFWVHLVSYLNLGACALNLATLTTRFVFPQFSLEGKRMWIVGMAPMGLLKVLQVKFWMAAIGSWGLTLGLMALSCHMLNLPWERTLHFYGIVTIMTFVLNSLAVGLGALFPNFKEDHPGKIVNGFGGTLCLVLSFVYILLSVVLLAAGSPWAPANMSVAWLQGWSWAGFVVISVFLGWLPLGLARKRLRTFEL
jgi:ABC-2 type transport system permease protein